jgi:YegS/Rv2252/BmrU family lipid kinase
MRRTGRRLARLDRHLLTRAAATRSPALDRALTGLSNTANNGVLWYGVAAVLTATGRRRPRTAAASGLLGLGIASTVVNGPLKFIWRRDRPPSDVLGTRGLLLPLPRTYSFPSGHAASAFAFATGVTVAMPAAGAAVLPLAGAVGYSRVHTGVHYPSDVVVGAALGATAGFVAGRVATAVRGSSVQHPDAQTFDIDVPRNALLLTSPHSGSADELETARAALIDAGFTIDEEIPVEELDRLADLVQAAGDKPALVIAAGGDGTVGAAANAVAGTSAILGVIPLGTSNDVARSLGVPPHPTEAVQALAGGRVGVVDAGQLQVERGAPLVFLNAATIGLNVAFAELATTSSMRDRFGGLTYPVAAARSVRRYVPFECTIEHDGHSETLELVHLSVSNAPVFGGVLGMRVPGASITDGLLDVIAIERLSLPRLALALADTVVGRHNPVHGVHAMRVESLTVKSGPGNEIALDGEVVGEVPATFTALPGALRVVLPRADA